jgi:2-methylcitrate dehydratase PrpD
VDAAHPGFRLAFLDWLACAVGGAAEPAAAAARAVGGGVGERVAHAGVAGHVLDFDDTYAPGLAHLSAAAAPAALVLGAELGASLADVLGAYAAGFEATGALSRASHPDLYERGWHPTSVCGVVGAAAAAGRLLGLEEDAARAAANGALLHSAGLRAAFGSDGKALQVGAAAAAGVAAARLAAGGARVPAEVRRGWEHAYGGRWAEPDATRPAVRENWIKAYPCCLQTHSTIEAALAAADELSSGNAAATVAVHPVSVQAAPYDEVATPLQSKFSIPYTAALAALRGPPRRRHFGGLDAEALRLAGGIEVETDAGLGESEAVLRLDGTEVARVTAPLGSPARPLGENELAAKVRDLAGNRLDGVLDDPGRPAAGVLAAAGL